jgi:diacylglycerol kinase
MTSVSKVWGSKFRNAWHGVVRSIRTQNSFWVHLAIAVAVIVLGICLHVSWLQWCVLTMAITIVLAAELFNTALEQLVATLHPEHDERIGHALDAAAGAVLVTAIGAAAVGLIVFYSAS